MSFVALIPARGGSKRLERKNIRRFFGHPLLAYTIHAARTSRLFSGIYVSTDDQFTVDVAKHYDARCIIRPVEYAADDSPDIDWIRHALETIDGDATHFAILRPTSPFRTAGTILRAFDTAFDPLLTEWIKAVEPAEQSPYKMWRIRNEFRMHPLIDNPAHPKAHSHPTQTLPTVYLQNGCLEIRPVKQIEPRAFKPFITVGYEGVDINTERDWAYAEWLVYTHRVQLPEVKTHG